MLPSERAVRECAYAAIHADIYLPLFLPPLMPFFAILLSSADAFFFQLIRAAFTSVYFDAILLMPLRFSMPDFICRHAAQRCFRLLTDVMPRRACRQRRRRFIYLMRRRGLLPRFTV